MHSFTYEFEELPLVIVNGIPAAMINGRVDINYWRNGEWKIDRVCVEGHQEISREDRSTGKRPWVYVPAPNSLSRLIIYRLDSEDEWRDKIVNAVSDQLDKDYECEPDDRSDIIKARRVEAA